MTEERHSTLGIHPVETDDPGELLKRRHMVRRAKVIAFVVLALLAAGAGRTVVSRISNAKVLDQESIDLARLYVKTIVPRRTDAGQTVVLPGTLQGYVQSPIAARASGYLRRWYKDIGSRVQKGELLAEIETPEIDQQLSQAVAARQQTASSLALAKSTMARWEALRKKDAVSQQELEERRSAAAQAQANLAAADANVERLRQLEGFKRVLAPFAGVITRRNVDVGDLISAGGGRALFLLAQTDPLRVYVNVPQAYAHLVHVGERVTVTQAELQGRTFSGEVTRTAGAIDTTTRTMQIEVVLPNREGTLLPGAYVQVALPLASSNTLVVPTNVLMFRNDGTRVAVVGPHGHVHLKPIKVGRDFGQRIEVLDGVTPDDRLITNPPDSIADGDAVTVVADAKDAK